jgi:hypothetical protein
VNQNNQAAAFLWLFGVFTQQLGSITAFHQNFPACGLKQTGAAANAQLAQACGRENGLEVGIAQQARWMELGHGVRQVFTMELP